MRRSAFALSLLLCAGSAAAESQRFTTEARDLKTGKLVYTEHYDVEVDQGRWRSGTTRYVAADGTPLAERKFDFSRDRYLPLYTFDQSGVDYREGITRIDAKQVDVFNVRDGEKQAASLPHVATMVADCGSQPFLIDHLDALAAGEILHFTLAVPGRADSYQLRARKSEDVTVDGHAAMRVRIELDNVLRLVLPTLELTIDPATKRLLEYSGIANVKDPSTRKAYSVRIRFSYS